MHILVTNDDGVQAPGLLALVQALREIGKVTVLAPDHNWSASGHGKTMHRPLRVKQVQLADGTAALATDGAPPDCVTLGLLGLADEPVDLVVSGINPNANLGFDAIYSGTVAAAREAIVHKVPGIAVSQETPLQIVGERDFTSAAVYGRIVAERVHREGLPEGTLLTVNVPYLPQDEIRGVRITRQGLRQYRDELVTRQDPHTAPYYWIGGEEPLSPSLDGSDADALAEGYVSVTPMQVDLTDYKFMEELRRWEF